MVVNSSFKFEMIVIQKMKMQQGDNIVMADRLSDGPFISNFVGVYWIITLKLRPLKHNADTYSNKVEDTFI